MDLVTVKQHLRVDGTAEDILINAYLAAATDFAETFLGRKLTDFETVPATVEIGLLMHTALLYENREAEQKPGALDSVKLLYWPHRTFEVTTIE